MRNLTQCLILLASLGFFGCDDDASEPEITTASAPTNTAAPEAPTAFEWTDSPTAEMIPAGPPSGSANGQPFEAKSIFFEPVFDEWNLVISDAELDSPTDLLRSGSQSVKIRLPQSLSTGTFTKAIDESGGGYWQVHSPDSENPEDTTSWNAPHAYVLQITKWEVSPYDEQGRLFQQAGTASGRVVVVYRGREGGDFQNSWVAGTFEDVPVRYMGRPRWMQQNDG